MRVHRIAISVLLLGVNACAGAVRGPVAPRNGPEDGTAIVGLVPARGPMVVLVGGEARVVEGPVAGARVVVSADGTVEASPDVMGAGVAAFALTPEGFLFLDRGGSLFRASSFLAPLEDLGRIELPDFEALSDSPGRLAVLSGMDLYTSTGALPLVRAELPRGTVVDAAFRDDLHGVVKLDGGSVLVTGDGGQTWRPLHLEAPAAFIGATRERLGVLLERTPPNVFVVNDAGDGGSLETWPDSPVALPELAIHVAIARAFPGFGLDQGENSPGVTLTRTASDSLLVRSEQAQFFLVEPRARTSTPIFGDRRIGCYFQRWGPTSAVLCVGTSEGTLVHRSVDGGSLERVFAMPPMERAYFSADGRSVAWRGGCPGGPSDELCVVRELAVFEHEAHAIGADRLSAPAGDWLLVSTGEERELHLRRLSDRTEVPIALPAERTPRVATLAADGSLLVIVATRTGDEEGRVLLTGSPGGPMTERALPQGVRGVAFLDSRRGLGAGADASVLARTFDGGETWESLPSPVRGDPESLSLVQDVLVGAPIGCDVVGCWVGVGMVVTVRGWGREVDARTAHLSSVPLERHYEGGALSRVALWCEATPASAPASAPWVGRTPRGATVITRVLGPTSSARISIGDERIRVEWRGRDERGSYAAMTRESPLTEVGPDLDPRLVLIHGARRGGIDLAVCPDGVCRTLHGSPDGVLVTVPEQGSSTTRTVAIAATLGGREVVLTSDPEGQALAVVQGVDADGTIEGIGSVSLPGYQRHFGLAVRGPGELAVVAERDSSPGFVLVPMGSDALPQVMGGRERLTVCAEVAAPGAWVATVIGTLRGDGTAGTLDSVLTVDLELTADAACVRAVRLGAEAHPDAAPAVLLADGDVLVGAGGTADGWNDVRCTLRGAE